MMKIAIDFETYYSKREYSIKGTSNWAYVNHPQFDPYMISVSDGADAWAGPPSEFNWDSLYGADLFSHNAAFDSQVYARMVELGLAPKIDFRSWHCTANLTSFLCNRRSLAEAMLFLYGIKVEKGMRDYADGEFWRDIVAEGKSAEMLKYARVDAEHCWRIANDYFDKWPAHEASLSKLTIDQGSYGIAVDVDKLLADIEHLRIVIFETEKTMPWWEGNSDFKATSPKAIAEACRSVGIPCPPIKSHEGGEEEFIAWEAEYGPRFAWIASVANWRSLNKVLATLETIRDRLRPDNTINFSLKYFGGHTGRWSGDSGLNMQNLRKSPLLFKDYSLTESEHEASYTIDVRKLFIPRPGKKFIICDLAQIEPRVLNWMCGNSSLLEKIAGGMSIYEAHARDTMGWTGGELKKEDKQGYKLSKSRCLGLGYGCGPEKFVTVAKILADYDITLEESKKVVAEFRQSNPLIIDLWKRLDTQFKNSLGGDFEMVLPAGRTMRYEKVRRESRLVKDRETGEMRPSLVFTAGVAGIRKKVWGSQLAENSCQAIARDVFAYHLLEADKQGYKSLFSVHDEAIFEVDPDVPVSEITKIMSTTPPWLEGCPIAAEGTEANCYLK